MLKNAAGGACPRVEGASSLTSHCLPFSVPQTASEAILGTAPSVREACGPGPFGDRSGASGLACPQYLLAHYRAQVCLS